MNPQGDISKLPVWARNHIETLEKRRQQAFDELNALKANEPTRVVVDADAHLYGPDNKPTYINERKAIRFITGDKQYIDVKLDGDVPGTHHGDRIIIRGDSRLSIVPSASNSVYVGTPG